MAKDIRYVKTGIHGVDEMLKGGIYPGSAVLVSGPPGSGKSIFAMQFIYMGAKEFGEKGLLISMEETVESLSGYAESIGLEGWDALVEKKDITVISAEHFLRGDLAASLEGMMEAVQSAGAKRMVIDSMNIFKFYFPEDLDRRAYLLKFLNILKRKGITSMLVYEVLEAFPRMPLTEESYLSDGNISLFMSRLGNMVERCFWVTKMRRQDFVMNIVPMSVGKGGVQVYPDAIPYSLTTDDK